MKTKCYYFIIATLLFINKQTVILAQNGNHCGTTQATTELREQHPELIQKEIDYNNAISKTIQDNKQNTFNRSVETVYIIPVVFHVLHINGTENISDEQIKDQINVINRDFRKLNADTSTIVAGFDTLAADIRIEFRLAQKDPNGNCTNGINRIYSHKTINKRDEAKIIQWPRDKYLNVWVIRSIGISPNTAGYSYYPPDVDGNPGIDGIVLKYDYVGSIGTSAPSDSRIMTHEAGHWLNLQHPWGSTNSPGVACGDDLVNDTPITMGHTSCLLTDSTCFPPIIENVQNYMDYSYCSRMFTIGQKERMRTALLDTMADRNLLSTHANLIATGTDSGTVILCPPLPEFYTNRNRICNGGNIIFTQNILRGTPTNTVWTFTGGTPATSTAATQTVVYNTPGIYDVKLWAINSAGADSVIKQSYIKVDPIDSADFAGLIFEDFENSAQYANLWFSNNPDTNLKKWELCTVAGYNSNQCVKMGAYENHAHDVDELYSPAYDLRGLNNMSFTFRCAGAKADTGSDGVDRLRIFYSVNCGLSWVPRLTLMGDDLFNNGNIASAFVPNNSSQWAFHAVNLPDGVAVKNVRFKFEFTSGNKSNNVYIDNINIVTGLGIAEAEKNEATLSVYPNPYKGSTTIRYTLNKRSDVSAEVFNIVGQKVETLANTDQAAGEYTFAFSAKEKGLESGIYFVKLRVNGKTTVKKIVEMQ